MFRLFYYHVIYLLLKSQVCFQYVGFVAFKLYYSFILLLYIFCVLRVFPLGGYGLAQPWYFLFATSYWRKSARADITMAKGMTLTPNLSGRYLVLLVVMTMGI